MYNRRRRYQSEQSYIPTTVNRVIESIRGIEENMVNREWDKVVTSFESAAEYIHDLDDVVAKKLRYFTIEPSGVANDNIPQILTAFFPAEKEEMDESLKDSYIQYFDPHYEDENELYADCDKIIEIRNKWSRVLRTEIESYIKEKRGKKERI